MPTLFPPHPHVVVHGLDSPDRPEFSSFVFDSCARPLPAWAINRVRSFEPNHNSNVIMEDHGERDALDPPQLSDVADAIFLVVSRARRLDARQSDFSPLLFFTVGACVTAVVQDAVLSDDTWVALRRVPLALADLGHLAPKYMLNPLLVLLPLPYAAMSTEEATPPAIPQPAPSVADASTDSSISEAPVIDLAEWLARPFKIPLLTYEYVFDDGPPAPANPVMHRVVSAAKPPRHLLSVLVVSSCDEIYDAVSSALYQRLSWNIHTPILGISFAHGSDVVRILIAWLEPSSQDSDELPRVHVLHAPWSLTQSHIARGVFSLRNPIDAMVLARLAILLSQTFENDSRDCQLLEMDAIPRWRADQLPIHEASVRKWSHESICQWISHSEGTVEANGIDSPSSPGLCFHDQEESNSASPMDHHRRYPFAEFVALRERQHRRPTATALWMIDRYVRQHCLPPIFRFYGENGYSNLRSDLEPHIPLFLAYRSATRFSWPTKWTSLDCLPVVPAPLASLAQELFLSHTAAGQPHCVASALSSPEISLRLDAELTTILQVCALAKSLLLSSTSQRYRFCYDMLLHVLSPCSGARVRSHVALRLSRSEYVDDIRSHSQETAASYVQGSGTSHELINFWEIHLFEDGDPQRDSVKRAHELISLDLCNWPSDAHSALKRVRNSPTTGSCDLAIVTGVPLRSSNALAEQHGSLIIDQPEERTFPAPLIPSWTTAENSLATLEEHRIVACNPFASAHYDYPSAAPGEDDDPAVPTPASATTVADREHQADTVANVEEQDVQMDDRASIVAVPVLIIVHSMQRTRFDIADSNRLRMCLTSTARYLGFLGVFDFPVFGLLTEGTRSAVVMAWAQDSDGFLEVHYLDQHCCAYDISVPAGAFNLATFFLWLQLEHAPRLAAILDEPERQSLFQAQVEGQVGSPCAGWSMDDQIRDLKETWSVDDMQQLIGVPAETERGINREPEDDDSDDYGEWD